MVLNLMLVWHFKHAGLALATSLSAFINAGLLFYGLVQTRVVTLNPGWGVFLARVVFANLCMLAVLYLVSPAEMTWFGLGFWHRFGMMLLICATGAVTYGASLLLVGYRPKESVR